MWFISTIFLKNMYLQKMKDLIKNKKLYHIYSLSRITSKSSGSIFCFLLLQPMAKLSIGFNESRFRSFQQEICRSMFVCCNTIDCKN